MSYQGHLLIRADAGSRMGSGHLMRCLALGQAWQKAGGRVTFLTHCEGRALAERITSHGIQFVPLKEPHPGPSDLETTLSLLGQMDCGWLAADGYHFAPDYQRAVRKSGHRLLVIDDTACWPEYDTDVLLNQNINAQALAYQVNPDARLLLGTQYALLRSEFFPWQGWRRRVPRLGRRVLVTMGGADPDNVTQKVMEALNLVGLAGLEAKVVVGPANPRLDALRRAAASATVNLEILDNPNDMPGLMAWADVAVSGAGSTCWELAYMGLPSILLVLAENQEAVAQGMADAGAAVNLGCASRVSWEHTREAVEELLQDAQRCRAMSVSARRLVDGGGGVRVVQALAHKRPIKSVNA